MPNIVIVIITITIALIIKIMFAAIKVTKIITIIIIVTKK